LGIGPNPQSPIPNPQSPFYYKLIMNIQKIKNIKIIIFLLKNFIKNINIDYIIL